MGDIKSTPLEGMEGPPRKHRWAARNITALTVKRSNTKNKVKVYQEICSEEFWANQWVL